MAFLLYVFFIKDKKVKIQRYVSRIPSIYANKLKFDEPKVTLNVVIRKDEQLYEKNKNKAIIQKAWDSKNKSFTKQIKKGFKPSPSKIGSQVKTQSTLVISEPMGGDISSKKPSIQPIMCWGH